MKKANTLSYIDLLPHLPLESRGLVVARTYTRSGGVSPKPYDSMNLGLFSGDERENVLKNMELLALDVGIEPSGIVVLDQVHGSKVRCDRRSSCGMEGSKRGGDSMRHPMYGPGVRDRYKRSLGGIGPGHRGLLL